VFVYHIFALFMPEMSGSFPSNIVHYCSLYLQSFGFDPVSVEIKVVSFDGMPILQLQN
jgi:hypothetical protein